MKHIGFTGTRKGLTTKQKYKISNLFEDHPDSVLHHGDCVGADAQAHDLAIYHEFLIYIHPPISSKYRAFKIGNFSHKPLPYLTRNKKIVDTTDFLIACPSGYKEKLRSGTWSTVRYARKKGKKIVIIYPSGNHVVE